MNRIVECFDRLKREGRKGFIVYIGAGDPNLDATRQLARAFDGIGVDVLELGVPFSDPLADGVVNQLAAQRGLASGTTPPKVLAAIRDIRKESAIPIVLYIYFNLMHRHGVERFVRDAADAGVDGLLVLDLPPEEGEHLDTTTGSLSPPERGEGWGEGDLDRKQVTSSPLPSPPFGEEREKRMAVSRCAPEEGGNYEALMREAGLCNIYLVAPTTPDERIEKIVKRGAGFIYCISREGVTGMQAKMAESIAEMTGKIRAHTSLPIAVGFGISTPEQARFVAARADAVVVGSAVVNQIAQFGKSADFLPRTTEFVKTLMNAVNERAK